ncbi:uncharacterized protein TNIN_290491 [Trichonephila inaurata madagascariensis]|uniref:Uncharacterized protein n=1 Tax=Trichonephila inaurata madagascariensis TaxID=2747483 RepID=A0A8X6WXE2_9ARAC|nr:uncharacterized protein TNIN_290491 [Trichonephila inaurata madagascariensis]
MQNFRNVKCGFKRRGESDHSGAKAEPHAFWYRRQGSSTPPLQGWRWKSLGKKNHKGQPLGLMIERGQRNEDWILSGLWTLAKLTFKIGLNAFGSITDQYERQSKYMRDLCNSVNINQMFKEEVVLFPPYLLKESTEACSETLSGIESLKEIKAIALKSNNISNPNWSIKDSILHQNIGSSHYTDSMLLCDRTLNNLVDDISSTLSNLHNHASEDFTETYNKLKLYLDVPPDNTIDVGTSFEAAKLKSETFLQLKDAVSMLQSSEIEQKRLNSELQSFQIPSEPLSDVLLGEYISILNEEKNDHT